MRSIQWIAGVAILTGVVFFLFGMNSSILMSITAAMSVVGLFYIGLLTFILKKSEMRWERVVGIGVLVLFTGFAFYDGFSNYRHSKWHHKRLTEDIRISLDSGLISIHLKNPLLKTLKAHYREQSQTDNIQQLFVQRNRDKITSKGKLTRFIPDDQIEAEKVNDPPFLYYDSTQTDNKVVLIGLSRFGNGERSGFKNYDGTRGNLQYKATLTPKGVDYVKEN